jgi:polysaccharide deacetylase 2 family uncharacterized protein YibQ
MAQRRVTRAEKTTFVVFLGIFALSSFCFALFNLTLGPEPLSARQAGAPFAELEIVAVPKTPELERLVPFWAERGFDLLKREKARELNPGGGELRPWVRGSETWVFVPRTYGLNLEGPLLELCGNFLAQGWSIQIERVEYGFELAFWSVLAEAEQKVPVYTWRLEILNPRNYTEHRMGFIPVMGELFDPYDLERGTPEAPVIALIVDDWGYHSEAAEPLLDYPFPLTIAVLPGLIMSRQLSEMAEEAGHEVILHQPMEPWGEDVDMGPGGIAVGMAAEEIERRLWANLASLPVVVGVNNHMGSKVTEHGETMEQVLSVLQELGLFFVDSGTTSRSVAGQTAQGLGVPYARNNLFIDNENDVDKIKEQLRIGLELAKKRGHAILIGHVRPNTAKALWEMIPEFLAEDVDFVPVSQLLEQW